MCTPGGLIRRAGMRTWRESGGRIVGEACHFIDFCCFLLCSRPVPGYCTASLAHEWRHARTPIQRPPRLSLPTVLARNSSIRQKAITRFPRRCLRSTAQELSLAAKTSAGSISISGANARVCALLPRAMPEEMDAWAKFLRAEAKHPMPYAQARQSMALTFAVVQAIRQRGDVVLESD